MDYYHLREWRNQQHQSDHTPSCSKIPRLLLEPPHQEASESSALPLFVPEPINSRTSNLSALPDSTITTTTSRVTRMIGFFSLAQWQELELQALIFKYMLAGAAIPSALLQPIKKSLFNTSSPPYYLHHPFQQYQHYQSTMLQSGYWGRTAVDPEPGRCRRTDGKKWRCSSDVVAGQKYCERHMHRGRNRSRKPVEIPSRPSPTTITVASAGGGAGGGCLKTTTTTPSVASLPITARNTGNIRDNVLNGGKSDGQVLRHFFDDWPKPQQPPPTNGISTNTSRPSSTTSLSISIECVDHHQSSSDFSLKLSTGIVGNDKSGSTREGNKGELSQITWLGYEFDGRRAPC